MASPKTDTGAYRIRAATNHDLPFLPTVESSAATLFTSHLDLGPLAEEEPMRPSEHAKYRQTWQGTGLTSGLESGTWVATYHDCQEDHSEELVGFIVTQPLQVKSTPGEGSGRQYFVHIRELSVHADHQRKGLASKLLEGVKQFAFEFKMLGLSLTTFRDVPFNGPFYARFGFREIPSEGNGGISEIIESEALKIWKEEQEHFANVGDGSLKERRCWMIAACG